LNLLQRPICRFADLPIADYPIERLPIADYPIERLPIADYPIRPIIDCRFAMRIARFRLSIGDVDCRLPMCLPLPIADCPITH
jgi:hypothetical protein